MKIGFLGFGNMAQAMAGGFVRSGAVQPGDIGACARDRAKLRRNTEPQGFRAFDDAAAVAEFGNSWRIRSSYRWPRALRSTTASGCSPPARTI